MQKLENVILDIYDDVNLKETFTKIASIFPRDILQMEIPTIEERNQLDDSCFALSMFTKNAQKLNKFPIHDKTSVYLSNEYFELNHGKLPFEAQKIAATYIKQACMRFGVNPSESVKVASEEHPTMTNIFIESFGDRPYGRRMEKTAAELSDNYYALVKQSGDGFTERSYAIPDVEHVKKAEAYFDKYASHFSPEDRHQYAMNVVKRAYDLGADLQSKTLFKYAGQSYGADLSYHLKQRQNLLDEKPYFAEALKKLAGYQNQVDPKTFAKTLHAFDKKAGIDKYYDKFLTDPFASTFGNPVVKTASMIYDKDGIMLTSSDIEKCSKDRYETLKTYFGQTLADGLKKDGVIAFEALPDDAKDVIARIANGEIQ